MWRHSLINFYFEIKPKRVTKRAMAGVARAHRHTLCKLLLNKQGDAIQTVLRVMHLYSL